jgi:hypothetical protein
MQSGAEKIDPAFVRKIFERTQAEATQSEKDGNTLAQYYALRSLVQDFKGMEDVSQFQGKLTELKNSKAWKNANRDEQREIDEQQALTATAALELAQLDSLSSGAQSASAQHIASVMQNLRQQEKSNGKDRAVSSRAFTQLLIQGIEAGQEQFRQGRYTQAAAYYSLMAEAAPDKPGPPLLLAEAEVRAGNKKEALKAIEQSVQRGLKTAKTLTDDPDLQPLATDPTFQEIVHSLS